MADSQVSKIDSWTETLKRHMSNPRFHKILNEKLLLLDREFGWTVCHALCSIRGIPEKQREKIFQEFTKKEEYVKLLYILDRDKDTIFHCAINHRCNKAVIEMLIRQIPRTSKLSPLCVRNWRNYAPLELAFHMHEWEHVKILLPECIELRILPELTGVDHHVRDSDIRETLLHQAFKNGNTAAIYLRIHLEACQTCNLNAVTVERSLVVSDSNKCTPWRYLIDSSTDEEIRQVLQVVKKYRIDINELYTNLHTRSTLLHMAYKQNRRNLADYMVEQLGADREKLDIYNCRPEQREKAVRAVASDCQLMRCIATIRGGDSSDIRGISLHPNTDRKVPRAKRLFVVISSSHIPNSRNQAAFLSGFVYSLGKRYNDTPVSLVRLFPHKQHC